MELNILCVEQEAYEKIYNELNIFNVLYAPDYIKIYKNYDILIATDKSKIEGIWILPLCKRDDKLGVEREYRFLPYCAPLIFEKSNLKVREVMAGFIEYMMQKYQYIEIPLEVGLNNISIIQAHGAFIEWRHTHVVNRGELKLSSRLKNHISYAHKNTQVILDDNISNFNFDIAIRGNENELNRRKDFAHQIYRNGQGFIVSVKDLNGEYVGGIFTLLNNKVAYWMHTWQTALSPRGTIAYLVKSAMDYLFEQKHIETFDFEGSVIKNVDYFFSGFDGTIIPYGYIHWSKEKKLLQQLIEESIGIEGRV